MGGGGVWSGSAAVSEEAGTEQGNQRGRGQRQGGVQQTHQQAMEQTLAEVDRSAREVLGLAPRQEDAIQEDPDQRGGGGRGEEHVEAEGRQGGVGGPGGEVSQGTQHPQELPPIPEAATLPTLEEAHYTYIPTHKWPPKAVRAEYTRVLSALWQRLADHMGDERLWIMEAIFHRVILHAGQSLDLGNPTSQSQRIRERLRRWQAGSCGEL